MSENAPPMDPEREAEITAIVDDAYSEVIKAIENMKPINLRDSDRSIPLPMWGPADVERAKLAIVRAATRIAEGSRREDDYGDWIGVQIEGMERGQAPAGAEFMMAHGRRGELRLMRWQEPKNGALKMVVTHYSLASPVPDRMPTFPEIAHAMKMWPKELPAGIPLYGALPSAVEAGVAAVEIWQSGPPMNEKKSNIIVVGG